MLTRNSVLARRWLTAGALGVSLALAAPFANAGTMAIEIRIEHRVHPGGQGSERSAPRPAPSYAAEQCPEKTPKRDTERKRLKRLLA